MTMSISKCSLWSILVAISGYLVLLQLALAKDYNQLFLTKKNFKVKSLITRTNLQNFLSETLNLDEFYSTSKNGSGRAKLQYENKNHDQEAVYYDTDSKSPLIFKPESGSCEVINMSDLNKKLFSGSQIMVEFIDRLASEQDHFIGPIKLLSYVLKEAKCEREHDITFKNHKSVLLKLERPDMEVELIYDKVTFTEGENTNKSPLPLELSIKFPSRELIIIDYKQFVSQESQLSLIDSKPEKVSTKSTNDLSLPVGFGCSRVRPQFDLFESMEVKGARLSFVAHTVSWNGIQESKHFVAFDGFSRSMRIDAEESTNVEMQLKVTRNSMKLIEFITNKKYTIIDDPTAKYGSVHSRLEPEILKRENNKCASTFALLPENQSNLTADNLGTMKQLTLGNLLFGSDKFAYMGQAKVREIETEIYEAYTDKPAPFWLEQPVVVKDVRGKYSLRNRNDDYHDLTYNYYVVIYLTGEKHKRLVAMELYDAGYKSPVKSVEFYDFVWDLSDSPMGDKSYNLFDRQDSCLSSIDGQQNQKKYAEVSLDLVAYYNANWTLWLNDMPQRQLAITASLKNSLDKHGFMLYDLESKSIMTKGNNLLRVSFRTVQHPDTAFNLTYLGNADQIYGQGVMPLQTSAQTPVDCFWLLDQLESKKPSFYVLYQKNYCITEPSPTLFNDRSLNQSKIFKMHDASSGEVYRIDWNPDDRSVSMGGNLFRSKLNLLEGKIVQIQVPLQGLESARETMSFRINNVNVHSVDTVNHLLSANDDEERPASVFPGYSLAQGQDGTWPFEPAHSLENRSVSLDQCQAGCLVDAQCKSFSFCNGWPQSTCLLSKFALGSPETSSLLASTELIKMSRGDKLDLSVEGEQVALVRDSKCELHHKLYSGLFERDWPAYMNLANQRVSRVANEDQCAERCFNRILDALELSDDLAVQTKRLIHDDPKAAHLTERARRFKATREQLARRFCDRFFYLEGSFDERQTKLIERRLEAGSSTGDSYCFITDLDYDKTLAALEKEEEDLGATFKLDTYKFDPMYLYERRPGFRLLSSQQTDKEQEAIRTILHQPTSEDIELLQEAFNSGRNLKLTVKSDDPNACARLCLFQSSGLYPVCQSFDFWPLGSMSCQLNTMTLNSLRQETDEQNRAEEIVYATHYEPRFKLLIRKTQLDAEHWSLPFSDKLRSVSIWVNSVQTVLICIVSIATGLIVGWIATEKYMRRRNINRSRSVSNVDFATAMADL